MSGRIRAETSQDQEVNMAFWTHRKTDFKIFAPPLAIIDISRVDCVAVQERYGPIGPSFNKIWKIGARYAIARARQAHEMIIRIFGGIHSRFSIKIVASVQRVQLPKGLVIHSDKTGQVHKVVWTPNAFARRIIGVEALIKAVGLNFLIRGSTRVCVASAAGCVFGPTRRDGVRDSESEI